jgi:hypothetical protein
MSRVSWGSKQYYERNERDGGGGWDDDGDFDGGEDDDDMVLMVELKCLYHLWNLYGFEKSVKS